VPQLVGSGPFGEINPNHDFGLNPGAGLHFFGGQSLTPAARFFLGQVCKRALRDFERLDLREDFSASGRHKAGTNSPGKHQLLAAIEANDQRIEGIARCVAADDEFLAEIDPILASKATIVAGGVAILLLSIGAIIGIRQGIWR
jgi:hypothetical protein